MSVESSDPKEPSLVSVNISDVFGLGKVAETFSPAAVKVVEGLGKILDPGLTAAKVYLEARAKSAAERHETKKNLQQISSVDSILAADPYLAEAMKARLIATELRRQSNIHSAVKKAIGIANSMRGEESTQDLDEDFVQEWVEGVKDVSSDDLQKIWAALLASAPKSPSGRISKPSLELLKQFDQPTAFCFIEFVKLYVSVGLPSARAPSDWAPFGVPIHLRLLVELGILERHTYDSLKVPALGEIKQVASGRRVLNHLLHTMEVFVFGQRAFELGNAIFTTPFEIDDELVKNARTQNFAWLANDIHWSLVISANKDAEKFHTYIVTAVPENENPIQAPLDALLSDENMNETWRQILITYAETGRMRIGTSEEATQ